MVAIVLGFAGVALVGYLLVSRWRGQVLTLRRLLLLPAVLTAIGVAQVAGAARYGYRPMDAVLIAAGVLVSALLGGARGATVAVHQSDGAIWLRYRPATLWLWLATIAVRAALTGLAYLAGARLAAGGPAFLLAIGTTLLAEAAMVARTAFSRRAGRWQARIHRHSAVSR
jgi:hypothetical protein